MLKLSLLLVPIALSLAACSTTSVTPTTPDDRVEPPSKVIKLSYNNSKTQPAAVPLDLSYVVASKRCMSLGFQNTATFIDEKSQCNHSENSQCLETTITRHYECSNH